MARNRGIDHAQRSLGNVIEIIKSKLKKQPKVKILEAGCGWGIAMLDLVKLFGNKIDIWGFNLKSEHGNQKTMIKEALKRHIFTKEQLKKIKLPKFYYCDASKRLPFKNNSFDVIFSQVTIYLIDNKVHFLEECNRLLKKEGIVRIAPSFEKYHDYKNKKPGKKGEPFYYLPYWEVWDKGKEINFWDYCKRIKGVKVVWKRRGQKGGNKPMYIEIKKRKKLNFKLKLVTAIDYNFIWKEWNGVKSIYTTQVRFKPHWKQKKR